jgi:hypothetical protein
MYITRLASNEIFSPSNKTHREVGRAKDLSASLYRRVGGPQRQSGRGEEILASPGFDPRTVQPVASRNTDYTIPAPMYIKVKESRNRPAVAQRVPGGLGS